ncbi:MAG TPA: thiol reductant ABC exporter subunit CydC [Candidatus Aveggerthella excrementigallinarum]|nr:thiol reductant ABC exporter subunit CydC [Candidatus Aveggerthella excrementigallinarum]
MSRDFAVSPRRRSHVSVMARLVVLTRPLLPVMTLAVILGVAGFAAAIFLTVLAACALLDIVGASVGIAAGAAVVGVIACGVLRGPLRYGEQLCNHYLAFKVLAIVRDRVFAKLRQLAPARLEGKDKGNLVSLVTSDVELLEVFYAHTLSPALIALVVSAGMTVLIGAQSPVLGAIALSSFALVGIVLPWAASKASGTGGRDVREGIGAMNTYVLDSLRGLSETLQFGRASDRSRELGRRMGELAVAERALKGRTAISIAAVSAIVMACDMAMLLAAAWLVMAGAVEFGGAVVAVAALMSSFGPVIAVANLGSTLQQTLAAGSRVLDLLEEEPATPDVAQGAEVERFEGAKAHGVSFSYGGEPVLEDVSLSVPRGSVVQIAGRSGSGKSTLLKLLMRFWDVGSGSIEVSGKDVRTVSTTSLRDVEGFMTQDTHLFAGTIRDNILIARHDADDAALREAVCKASLDSFIDELPRGLDTPVGELGDALSGGERQRLGLARVFLHDAPFVLLDEPTSNLDALSEAAVLRALSDNKAGKTIVLVSHRPSAATIADMRYSVERGRVS